MLRCAVFYIIVDRLSVDSGLLFGQAIGSHHLGLDENSP